MWHIVIYSHAPTQNQIKKEHDQNLIICLHYILIYVAWEFFIKNGLFMTGYNAL